MKTLLLALALLLPMGLTACASAPAEIQTEGALRRQVERVCDRHDAYVLADESLSDPDESAFLAESASARAAVELPALTPAFLISVLGPVMDRHDAYVRADGDLDEVERGVYLGSTEGVRSLLRAGE